MTAIKLDFTNELFKDKNNTLPFPTPEAEKTRETDRDGREVIKPEPAKTTPPVKQPETPVKSNNASAGAVASESVETYAEQARSLITKAFSFFPAKLEAMKAEIRLIIAGNAKIQQINTPEQLQNVADLTIEIKKIGKTVEQRRKEIVSPLNAKVDEINGAFKPVTEKILQIEKDLKNKIIDYDSREKARIAKEKEESDKKAREEKAAIEKAIAEKEAQRLEAIRKEAEKKAAEDKATADKAAEQKKEPAKPISVSGGLFSKLQPVEIITEPEETASEVAKIEAEQAELIQQFAAVAAPVKKHEEPAKIAGASFSDEYTVEIVSDHEFFQWCIDTHNLMFLKPEIKKIESYIKACKGKVIPKGCNITTERSMKLSTKARV